MTNNRDRAVVISSSYADSTGAGGNLGVFGNVASLKYAGFHVINIALCPKCEVFQKDIEVNFIDNIDETQKVACLKELIEGIEPTVIWLHHYWIYKTYKSTNLNYPIVALTGDPDWKIFSLRNRFHTKRTGLKRIYQLYKNQERIAKAKKFERAFCEDIVKQNGVLACWCPGEIPSLQERVGFAVEECYLTFPDWGQRMSSGSRNILYLGNLDGVATRTGIEYFLDHIYYKLLDYEGPKIRMVGGGRLPSTLKLPINSENFENVGFVEDLELEWDGALAILVTVPIELGYRTRIVEAWSKGVPVIAHPAAKDSLTIMEDGRNCLFILDFEDFTNAVKMLRDNIRVREAIIQNARDDFEEHYLATKAWTKYETLSRKAIKNFKNN